MSRLPFRLPDMVAELRRLLDQVPAGQVTTCGTLAEALGNPIAARWVGHYLLHHEHGPRCPCFRVVRAGGRLGPFIEGGPPAQAQRLADEGVDVADGQVDLDRYGCERFEGPRPLRRLRRIQERIVAKVSLRSRRRVPRLVGGVDVSYPAAGEGVAAYALVDTQCGELVWSRTLRREVTFPYITSYLTFRELPILLALLHEVARAGRLAEVVLVDGSGIMHQRHAGIATHLGAVADLPTVGVTKTLLCGRVDIEDMAPGESRPVIHEDRLVGLALRPTSGSRRPLFISPGHRVNVAFAEQVVRRVLCGRRLPEPLYWADRLSRHARGGSGG